MSVVDTLTRARDRVADPSMWCQGGPRDDGGTYSTPSDTCAVCAFGAIAWTTDGCPWHWSIDPAVFRAVSAFERANNIEEIGVWNDAPERTHAEVMAAFDRAVLFARRADYDR